jgi:hypothetical protein
MKKNLFTKAICIFITFIFICGLFPAVIFAQPDLSLNGEIKGFNRSVFDSHFSRADRELSPERWLFEAKLGITQAVNSWELIAFSLYDDQFLFGEARGKLEKWSSEELENRFSRWLLGRFFGEAAEKSMTDFHLMFGETQKYYSWLLDEKGNIIFDDRTGDPHIIRPDDANDFSADLAMWRSESESHLNTNSKSFEALMASLYAELLAYIPHELRENMSAVIMETRINFSEKIKREFENTAAREERIFTNRRTRDILSLRKKSGDEAAEIFTQKLIAETEEICTRGIEDLSARIEAASAGAGDLALLGEEWLRLYKEQFDRGLKAWEEAEERFFIRRFEWEQDSFTLFSEGEKMWLDAFNKFEEERKKWELKAKELFDSGEQLFKNISQEFEKNIADAKHEFELNMAMRIGEGTAKIKSLIDMYLVCASAAVSAMESVQFWHSQYKNSAKINPKDPEFYAWLVKEQTKSKDSSLAEIKKSYDLYISYTDKALDARERIMSNYSELFGAGALKDILLPGVSSEDFCLDEYQLALIRAKALVLYWERKSAINEAVMAYAGELSAGRMTEAEGILAWENARADYNKSLAVYEKELNKLNALGEDIQKQQKKLQELTQELQQAEETLNRLNSEYTTLVTASIINRGDFYLLELNTVYEFLVDEYKTFLKSGDEAVYKKILEYGMKWDIAEKKETAEYLLNILINGDDDQIPSLTKLEKNASEGKDSEINLTLRLAALDMIYDSQTAQLRPLDSGYSGADWYSKAKGLSMTEEEKVSLYGEKLRARLAGDFKISSAIFLEKRLELELNSLLFFLTGNSLTGEYIQAEHILSDSETSAFIYETLLKLKDRIDLKQNYFTVSDEENEIINYFLSGGSFFEGSHQYLKDYLDEYNLCLGLFEIYNEYAFISPFVQTEFRNEALISLTALFDNYSIKQSGYFLPDVKDIYASIQKGPGDLIKNTAQFLLKFDECFEMIPQWLENEINNWKYSLTGYIAANAFYDNIQPEYSLEAIFRNQTEIERRYNDIIDYAGTLKFIDDIEAEKINSAFMDLNKSAASLFYQEQIIKTLETLRQNAADLNGEKHWRQYLSDDYLTENDPLLVMVSTLMEGILADAYYSSFYYTGRLNDSFSVFFNNVIDYSNGDAGQFYNIYSNEISNVDHSFNSLAVLYNEIAGIGRTFELSLTSSDKTKNLLKEAYDALTAHESIFNALRNNYFLEAEKFFNTGSIYDKQYGVLKKAFEDSEQKHFEYEKQDAVRRWASTAYLNTDHIDQEYTKEKLFRAQTVLDVLSDIYKNENRRPYDNPVYNELYSEYEISFKRKLKILETVESLMTAIQQEYTKNEKIFSEYQNALHQLGYVDQNYLNYISPNSRYDWSLKDIITVNNGLLSFSRDSSMTLSGVDAQRANELSGFFNTTINREGERFEVTQFEEAVKGLSQRMAVYFTDAGKFKQWSLARDYLITSLIEANTDLSFLDNYYYGLGQMTENGSLGSLLIKEGPLKKKKRLYSAIDSDSLLSQGYIYSFVAWFTLSEEERADLEFYTILTLSGMGNHYSTGFSQMFTFDVYSEAYDYVYRYYKKADAKTDDWYDVLGFVFKSTKDVDDTALKRVGTAMGEIQKNVQKWTAGLNRNFSSIRNLYSSYMESCNKIEILEGKKTQGQNVEWADINNAVLTNGKYNQADISELKSCWEKMQNETGWKFNDIVGALTGLFRWAKETEEKNKTALENRWLKDAQSQQNNEIIFMNTMEAYIAGDTDISALKTAANNAYGKNAASWKNHLDNINTVLINDLSMYLNINFNFLSEFRAVGNDINAVTGKLLENRYAAEYSAREFEWDLALRDLKEKYNEWLNTAALIFENGRTDWDASVKKMEAAYKEWGANFQNEYRRVSDEWDEAYLAGIIDKERWLEQAATAANQASAESFLSLVGTEAERLSRFIDTREPLGIRNAVPETDLLITGLLQSSGISNMYSAFDSLNNIANTASVTLKRGMGGVSLWDAAFTKTAAADLARKTSAEIAERESRKLAFNARLAADEALKNLIANVDAANDNFRSGMDNIFILDGLWKRSGKNYVKDIVKGSTLFTPVISDTVTVTGYKNYKTEAISLRTNMDENYLAALDTLAVRGLLENVYKEIGTIAAEIFGLDEDPTVIKKAYFEERRQSPGRFGVHIGYSPAVKPYEISGAGRDSVFYDEGAGELGRLMSEYIYWSVIDGKGYAELALASWDKRIWDDEDSFFKAPTLRSAGSIAATVAATTVTTVITGGAGVPAALGIMALGVGVSSADDLIFNALDIAYGYKSFSEAGFEFGKSVLMSTAGSLTSGIFNGIGAAGSVIGDGLTKTAVNSVTGAASKVLMQTAMTGLQTAVTGLTTNAIGAVNYSGGNGFSWSGDAFKLGAKNILANAASSMTNTLTAGTLQLINSGVSLNKLTGFSRENMGNLFNLNSLAGSIAGQGINYALENDFTLNVLNLSLLTNGNLNNGLLELHLGGNGVSMNIGAGGANVSIDNLAASFKGALVWNTNFRINSFVKGEKDNFDSAVSLRGLYGFGNIVQKGELWNILKRDTVISTNNEGDFFAETTIMDGKKTINLSGYRTGMSVEDQMRLAAVLGHEAYRDGYKTGETDSYGNLITEENSYNEFKNASIARLAMADRINQDYDWFYDYNSDFAYEKILTELAAESGEYALFDYYIQYFYDNSSDYFFQKTSARGNFQNKNEDWRAIPLLDGKSKDEVDAINQPKLIDAFERYKEGLSEDKLNDPGLFDNFKNLMEDKQNRETYGYDRVEFESVYLYACRLLSTKYAVEAITGMPFNTIKFHNYIKENGFYSRGNEMSREDMVKTMNSFSNGMYSVEALDIARKPGEKDIYALDQSNTMYLACLEVKGASGGSHFVMVTDIEFSKDGDGKVSVKQVNVSNPWSGSTYTGKQSYTYGEIERWDIFKVTQTSLSSAKTMNPFTTQSYVDNYLKYRYLF